MINIVDLKKLACELNVLYVEDDEKLQNEVALYLRKLFKSVTTANDGLQGLEKYNSFQYDLVITDINMPYMNGLEMSAQIKEINPSQNLLIVSGGTEVNDFSTSISIGIDGYVIKPIEFNQLNKVLYKISKNINNNKLLLEYQKDLEKKVSERTKEIQKTRLDIIRCLGRASDYRDNETGLHIIRMSHYSRILTRALFPQNKGFINLIYNASPLHDVGKIGIPDAILLKPGKFNSEEWEIMKKHTLYGSEIISNEDSKLMRIAKEIAITHHEKWDGSGYPAGLKGNDIPMSGRIVAVADVFDALTTIRPYKSAWSVDEAIKYINDESGKHFDPQIVQAFNLVINQFIQIKANYEENSEDNNIDLMKY